MPDLRFISGNTHKIKEAQSILAPIGFDITGVKIKIEEIQTLDIQHIVRDKCVKAFKKIGRPLFVEHTALFLEDLNGYPGGLTESFWETLGPDKFSERFRGSAVIARTVIGYCDGQKINQFSGEISGSISEIPRGNRDFQWDCVFVPVGYDETFAELGDKKNEISMRRLALDQFAQALKGA